MGQIRQITAQFYYFTYTSHLSPDGLNLWAKKDRLLAGLEITLEKIQTEGFGTLQGCSAGYVAGVSHNYNCNSVLFIRLPYTRI